MKLITHLRLVPKLKTREDLPPFFRSLHRVVLESWDQLYSFTYIVCMFTLYACVYTSTLTHITVCVNARLGEQWDSPELYFSPLLTTISTEQWGTQGEQWHDFYCYYRAADMYGCSSQTEIQNWNVESVFSSSTLLLLQKLFFFCHLYS
jgi:hypothetical protein